MATMVTGANVIYSLSAVVLAVLLQQNVAVIFLCIVSIQFSINNPIPFFIAICSASPD